MIIKLKEGNGLGGIMMKKTFAIICALLSLMTVAACDGNDVTEKPQIETPKVEVDLPEKEEPDVEEPEIVDDVTLTVDFELINPDGDLDKYLDSTRYESLVDNGDGTVTMVMSPDQHETLMIEVKDDVLAALRHSINRTDLPMIREVYYNDDLTSMGIEVNPEQLDNENQLLVLYFTMVQSVIYHQFNGTEGDYDLSLIDDAQIELSTYTLPQDLYKVVEALDARDVRLMEGTVSTDYMDVIGISYERFLGYQAGHEYILVDLAITNTSTEPLLMNQSYDFSLQSSTGVAYSNLFAGGTFPSKELAPGELCRGTVGFEVERGSDDFVLIIDVDSIDREPVEVEIRHDKDDLEVTFN